VARCGQQRVGEVAGPAFTATEYDEAKRLAAKAAIKSEAKDRLPGVVAGRFTRPASISTDGTKPALIRPHTHEKRGMVEFGWVGRIEFKCKGGSTFEKYLEDGDVGYGVLWMEV